MEQILNQIEKILGYKFKNKEFLSIAFTHSSFGHLNQVPYNERQEFLGDSLLNLITTTYLYNNCSLNEGEMSKVRAYLVSCDYLSDIIQELDIIKYLRVASFDPKKSKNAMGDLFEAIIAGIYLDSDYKTAEKFVLKTLKYSKELINEVHLHLTDYKTMLQEIVQKNPKNKLNYELIEKTGPAHAPIFTISLILNGEVLVTKTGRNKKQTENECAKFVIDKNIV